MNTDIFKSAAEKRFTEFSQAVKSELKSKLANRDEIKTHVSDFEKIQQMKASFAQINKEHGATSAEE